MFSKIFRQFAIVFVATLTLCACQNDDHEEGPDLSLPVTYGNIQGEWTLAYINLTPVDPAAAMTITLLRSERTFSMVNHFDSMYPRTLTGSYELTTDDNGNVIISGTYDYWKGDWSHTYLVKLNDAYTMDWYATDDSDTHYHFTLKSARSEDQ